MVKVNYCAYSYDICISKCISILGSLGIKDIL